ncbi:glutathione peroxidase [Chitinibacter sp. SCUT-21]|uniref:glutathione peroxidase n=1 Tax=Chitinibacter sp. SCUT-21 TaxID=2970891 RepID=UPI0035A6FE1E
MSSIYEIPLLSIDGQSSTMAQYQGQVLLIVNVASRCGFTPQYAGLQALYQRFHERGFTVLAFPCNQFGLQEPDAEPEIAQFCASNYATQFPLFAKTEVNGAAAHPLFQFLCQAKPGLLGTEAIKWNFTKFLLDRNGQVVGRYAPTTTPESLADKIESLL